MMMWVRHNRHFVKDLDSPVSGRVHSKIRWATQSYLSTIFFLLYKTFTDKSIMYLYQLLLIV